MCDVLQFLNSCDVYSVVFYGHSSSMVFVCTTPRQGGLRHVRQENFVPSRRFREDGLEDSKLSRGGGTRVNTLGAPAVAKQTKPINSDSMQVEVEPMVSIP